MGLFVFGVGAGREKLEVTKNTGRVPIGRWQKKRGSIDKTPGATLYLVYAVDKIGAI